MQGNATSAVVVLAIAWLMVAAGTGKRRLRWRSEPLCQCCRRPVSRCRCCGRS